MQGIRWNYIYLPIFINLFVYVSTDNLLCPGSFLSFLILHTVGRTPWTRDQSFGRLPPTPRTAQIQNKSKQASLPQAGFETKIPLFDRTKTVHDLYRATTVVGIYISFKYLVGLLGRSSLLRLVCSYIVQKKHKKNMKKSPSLVLDSNPRYQCTKKSLRAVTPPLWSAFNLFLTINLVSDIKGGGRRIETEGV
jgi:hypothetical protein